MLQLARSVAILTLTLLAGGSNAASWRTSEGTAPLYLDSTHILVRLSAAAGPTYLDSLIADSATGLAAALSGVSAPDGFVICSLRAGFTCETVIESLRQNVSAVEHVQESYTTVAGDPFLYGYRLAVRFVGGVAPAFIDSLADAHNLTIVRQSSLVPDLYYFAVTPGGSTGAIAMANRLDSLSQTLYAAPNHILTGITELSPNYQAYDYYRRESRHVTSSAGDWPNRNTCWDITTGDSNILVAVFDGPVAPHDDLPESRLDPNYYYVYNPFWTPQSLTPGFIDAHGQAVAGIIAASHALNPADTADPTTGVLGMAPGVTILSIGIYGYDEITGAKLLPDFALLEEAFDWARAVGADIANHSWGYDCNHTTPQVLNDALTFAAGSGMIQIVASGNDPLCSGSFFPASHDSVIRVAAWDIDNDEPWWYNQGGPAEDGLAELWAPSSDLPASFDVGTELDSIDYRGDVWTLDFTGNLGYNSDSNFSVTSFTWDCFGPDTSPQFNNRDYMCHFGGTSAATPIVTGIAALLLSVNDTLSRASLLEILDSSAIQYTGTDSGYYRGGPDPDTASNANYQKVDALRALLTLTRGDANNDGSVNIADISKIMCYMFGNSDDTSMTCDSTTRQIRPDRLMGDANCSGAVNIADVTHIVSYIFSGGPGPLIPCYNFDQYGAVLKTVASNIVVSREPVGGSESLVRIATDHDLHALDISLVASDQIQFDKRIAGLGMYWEQLGDTTRIALLDPYGRRMITPADSVLLHVVGEFEIVAVEATDIGAGGGTGFFRPTLSNDGAGSRAAQPSLPVAWRIGEPYPNPFNPTVSFQVAAPEKEQVKIEVFNLRGQRVDRVYHGDLEAGDHMFKWTAHGASSGIYLIRISAGSGWSATRKVALLK